LEPSLFFRGQTTSFEASVTEKEERELRGGMSIKYRYRRYIDLDKDMDNI